MRSGHRIIACLLCTLSLFSLDIPACPPWNAESQGKFILASFVDSEGGVWVGTEDGGIWSVKRGLSRWRQVEPPAHDPGAGVIAFAEDGAGRVWAGRQGSGLTIFHGDLVTNFPAGDGPLGGRVSSLYWNPSDQAMWFASNRGVGRYSLREHAWEYRWDPAITGEQIAKILPTTNGIILVSSLHTVFIADDRGASSGNWAKMLQTTTEGFITNAATSPLGLFITTGQGVWLKKNAAGPLTNLPVYLGTDDRYITALLPRDDGKILIGRRQGPVTVRSGPGGKDEPLPETAKLFTTCLTRLSDDEIGVGTAGYGFLVIRLATSIPSAPIKFPAAPRLTPAVVDTAASVSDDGISALIKKISPPKRDDGASPRAALLDQDWETHGDWVGRYGRQFAILCAAAAPTDHILTNFTADYDVRGSLGPNHSMKTETGGEDLLRHWISWKGGNDARALWNPLLGERRQSEWDDHGETYPITSDGPDILIDLAIKRKGLHRVSLYFTNKDGHEGFNRYRDYLIEWRAWNKDLKQTLAQPPLLVDRCANFWSGVYLRALVNGGNQYLISIRKNGSFNTILSSVFIDRITGDDDAFDRLELPFTGNKGYLRSRKPKGTTPATFAICDAITPILQTDHPELYERLMSLAWSSRRGATAKFSDGEKAWFSILTMRSTMWTQDERDRFLDEMKSLYSEQQGMNGK